MQSFDLVLVLGYFRLAASYLSIIRYLAPEMRVGLIRVPTDDSLKDKTGEAEAIFIELCRRFGAEILTPSAPVRARLAVFQQFSYSDSWAARVDKLVDADRRVGLMALATAGLANHDQFLTHFGIRKVYVPSARFMHFLLERRNAASRYAAVEVEEVGLPFGRYPVFPEFSVDWLIAAPTLFSFSSEAGKQSFLHVVLDLLGQMNPNDLVAYKPHNGNALDYFAPRFHYALAASLEKSRFREKLVRNVAASGPRALQKHADRTLTSMLHRRVLERAKPMSSCTPYGDISLEAFLPGVRKGVIGGLSNSIWGTLYFGLPFFNCIEPSTRNAMSELLPKSSSTLLDVNLEYFGVPYCAGRLERGSRGESIVVAADRQGDLLEAVRHDLGSLPVNALRVKGTSWKALTS